MSTSPKPPPRSKPPKGIGLGTGPTAAEAKEIVEIARAGAGGAGASGPDLDDVAQAVVERFTAKWEEPHLVAARARGHDAWRNYIVRSARNAYRDLHRGRRRSRQRELKANGTHADGIPASRPGTLRPLDDRPTEIDQFLARRAIAEMIDGTMIGRQHEVATLVFVEGLTSQEAADQLDISVRTVNRLRADAIVQLRVCLSTTDGA